MQGCKAVFVPRHVEMKPQDTVAQMSRFFTGVSSVKQRLRKLELGHPPLQPRASCTPEAV